ncbi:hypothetical protein ACQKP7_02140 [Pseudomonas frederiksbergensis]|uniref:hypothetical protein n=1 Tax=Pseudomonas frederiksbergensis TaxID=104087 RepID=UPI003CFD6304
MNTYFFETNGSRKADNPFSAQSDDRRVFFESTMTEVKAGSIALNIRAVLKAVPLSVPLRAIINGVADGKLFYGGS